MIKVWTDASIEGGNPGGHLVCGYIIKNIYKTAGGPQEDITGTLDLGKHPTYTSNIGEYSAVIAALKELVNLDDIGYPLVIRIHTDSKLVVNQCNDVWKCNDGRLRELRDDIWQLCDVFTCPVEFKWISREENEEADAVSRSLY